MGRGTSIGRGHCLNGWPHSSSVSSSCPHGGSAPARAQVSEATRAAAVRAASTCGEWARFSRASPRSAHQARNAPPKASPAPTGVHHLDRRHLDGELVAAGERVNRRRPVGDQDATGTPAEKDPRGFRDAMAGHQEGQVLGARLQDVGPGQHAAHLRPVRVRIGDGLGPPVRVEQQQYLRREVVREALELRRHRVNDEPQGADVQGRHVGLQCLPCGGLIQHEGRRLGDMEPVLGYALAVERHDGQRRRLWNRIGQGQLYPVLDQLRDEGAGRTGRRRSGPGSGWARPAGRWSGRH